MATETCYPAHCSADCENVRELWAFLLTPFPIPNNHATPILGRRQLPRFLGSTSAPFPSALECEHFLPSCKHCPSEFTSAAYPFPAHWLPLWNELRFVWARSVNPFPELVSPPSQVSQCSEARPPNAFASVQSQWKGLEKKPTL